MTKYIMLYNYDHEEYDLNVLDAVMTMFPDAKLENYSICNPNGEIWKHEGSISLWLPENQYLACWMFVNMLATDDIENGFLHEFLDDYTIDDGIEYMNRQLEYPDLFVQYL